MKKTGDALPRVYFEVGGGNANDTQTVILVPVGLVSFSKCFICFTVYEVRTTETKGRTRAYNVSEMFCVIVTLWVGRINITKLHASVLDSGICVFGSNVDSSAAAVADGEDTII